MVTKLNGFRGKITTLVLFVFSLLAVTVIAKHFMLIISDPHPSLPILRAQVVQTKAPSFPASRVNDTASVLWNAVSPSSVSGYVKISDLASIQWLETVFHTYGPASPLIIDLGRNGFKFGKKGTGVIFDLLATGDPLNIQWVMEGTDDGFLVHDINNNGVIDDGSELFGNGTSMVLVKGKAQDGYKALSQYDLPQLGGNNDGLITKADDKWKFLKLWVDSNANGVTDSNEIKELKDYGIKSIGINPRITRNRTDPAGNLLPYWSWVTTKMKKGPKKMKMVDVFFQVIRDE